MVKFFVQYRRLILFIIAIVVIFWLLWVLRNILLPFIIGLILAYLLLPPIIWLEKKLPRKNRLMRTKRVLLIILLYLAILAIIGLVAYFTIPPIANSVAEFFEDLPQLIPDLAEDFQNLTDRLRQSLPPQIRVQVDSYLSGLFTTIGDALRTALTTSIGFISGTFGLILGFAALPVFLFYLLKDSEKLSQGFYSGMSAWTAEQARTIIGIIEDVLGRYIRSSIILGLSVGLLDFIGLLALGIRFAPALAFWAALTELIPVLGPWLGAIPGVIVTLATDPGKTIWVIVVYVSVQLLEGNILVPRIHGQYLQIHPAIILLLLVIGGHFAGLWGIILIVPVVSTLIKIYRYIAHAARKEEFQSPQG